MLRSAKLSTDYWPCSLPIQYAAERRFGLALGIEVFAPVLAYFLRRLSEYPP